MPAIATISIADAQATPVTHNFIPLTIKGDTAWFEDTSSGTPAGFWRISLAVKRKPDLASGDKVRVELGLHMPVLESATPAANGFTPAPTVAYVPQVFVTYLIPARSSLQARKDLRKMLSILTTNTQVVEAVENLSTIY